MLGCETTHTHGWNERMVIDPLRENIYAFFLVTSNFKTRKHYCELCVVFVFCFFFPFSKIFQNLLSPQKFSYILMSFQNLFSPPVNWTEVSSPTKMFIFLHCSSLSVYAYNHEGHQFRCVPPSQWKTRTFRIAQLKKYQGNLLDIPYTDKKIYLSFIIFLNSESLCQLF